MAVLVLTRHINYKKCQSLFDCERFSDKKMHKKPTLAEHFHGQFMDKMAFKTKKDPAEMAKSLK